MATTAISSNYWTATAHHVQQHQDPKYVYDDCGIKHRINPEDANDLQPCEPWCTSCGYPPHICDPYFTRCTGTKLGHWEAQPKGDATSEETPMTPDTAEVVVLTTGAWYLGWNAKRWTPIPRFEEQWTLAKTPQERASLLAFYSPNASLTLTHYQQSILMNVTLPATTSDNPDAELTFCDGTIRKRVCDFAYCVEDSEGDGYWYCDACRNFATQQEQEQDED